ncbi:hypothetical protein CCAX7_43980 [Capsulimonas corticalis]|uniref:Uncharacterized protein n=1 Tax=Capsulimonas corticalis TaxID=2219043 RepID=A0A402CXB5_9BACT|nr:hypothetical protein CCAX7_43980 [Capsulimonas corticalis]
MKKTPTSRKPGYRNDSRHDSVRAVLRPGGSGYLERTSGAHWKCGYVYTAKLRPKGLLAVVFFSLDTAASVNV